MGSKGHGVEELSEFAMEFIKQAGKKALPFYGKGQTRACGSAARRRGRKPAATRSSRICWRR